MNRWYTDSKWSTEINLMSVKVTKVSNLEYKKLKSYTHGGQVMNKCIYSLYDDEKAHFLEREHVFPKAIGGLKMLPKGYVSDEVNHRFSVHEENFIHNAVHVFLPRNLYGPSGRKSHSRKHQVGFIRMDSHIVLGYMEKRVPCTIWQILVAGTGEDGKYQVTITHDLRDQTHIVTSAEAMTYFSNLVKSSKGNVRIVRENDDSLKNCYILGIDGKALYIGVHENCSDQEAEAKTEEIKSWILKNSDNMNIDESDNLPEYHSGLANMDIRLKIDIRSMYIVLGKIVFNCLAMIKGQEFVLDARFDGFRNAILNENVMRNYFIPAEKGQKPNGLEKSIEPLLQYLQLSPLSHGVIFLKISGNIGAIVFLYGSPTGIFISLEKTWDSFFIQDINFCDDYFCDWQNGREGSLTDFLKK